jgi:DNA helicase-2/ATP-dependent DNA helicase PcrA
MKAYYPGGEVNLIRYRDAVDEAAGIAGEIAALLSNGIEPWKIAVLGRSTARLRHVVTALQDRGLPTTNWLAGAYGVQERRALRVSLSVIRGRLNDTQAKDFVAFIGQPDTAERDPVLLLEAYEGVKGVAELREVRRLAWEGRSAIDVVEAARAAARQCNPELGASLDELVDSVRVFNTVDPSFSLDHLDAELALKTMGPPTEGGGVKVASLHRTKGLQWPCVFILGLEQGTLPDYRSQHGQDLREERRLCFVGMTRAEQRLDLSWAQVEGRFSREPSQFLREINEL